MFCLNFFESSPRQATTPFGIATVVSDLTVPSTFNEFMEFNDFIREEQKEVEVNTTTWLNSVEVLKNAREEQHGNEDPKSPHAQFQQIGDCSAAKS